MKLLRDLLNWRGALGTPAQAPVASGKDDLPADFSADEYLALHDDVRHAQVDPGEHYRLYGRTEGRPFRIAAVLPEDFDADTYLALHPDLVRAGVDPLRHYLSLGRHEGRLYSLASAGAAAQASAAEAAGRASAADAAAHDAGVAAAAADAAALEQLLPSGFNRELYRRLHPDLSDPSVDVAAHYLSHGRQEGRIYSLPDMVLQGETGWDPARPTVLVVSHEASRTGAPVLSLNLVQELLQRYNVVALLLGDGALANAFVLAGAVVAKVPGARGNAVLAEYLIGHLQQRFPFQFALVNSIESRIVLAPLAALFVPTISLVHEFASYTRPRDAFRSALAWSGEVVFSARVTMDNAFAEYPDLGPRSAHILPQGRCLLPADGRSDVVQQDEAARLRRLMRPVHARDAVVVLGAGFVQLRKGIELFLECAARMLRTPGGDRCRFIWIGRGYDPDQDIQYSVYLADQIRRAGLEQHMLFIDETSAIETAYDEADLLLLSSRLDPLPNVAIDAMVSGVPVLCFDKTTGIADFLVASGLREHCVAEYLDTSELAQKAMRLVDDATLRATVAQSARAAAEAYFSMPAYVAQLEQLAGQVAARSRQEQDDTATIVASGLFRPDFACPVARRSEPLAQQVRQYVRAWASGIDRRQPYPGFHPGIYLEQHGVSVPDADPLADYLRAGAPQGPWNYPVARGDAGAGATAVPTLRSALHLHVYYPDLLEEMVTRLGHNKARPDLFVSIADESARAVVEAALAGYPGRCVAIEVMPHRGRDIAPFLTAFGPRLLAGYDVVGHLHTKKSRDVQDPQMGVTWYRFLLENLLGSADTAAADQILGALQADSSLGMVFPVDPHVLGMGGNRAHAASLAARLGLGKLPEHFLFPVGSMFWARTAALAPLIALGLNWDDYPDEPLPYDGSTLHALERLFALSLPLSGLRFATTNAKGVTR